MDKINSLKFNLSIASGFHLSVIFHDSTTMACLPLASSFGFSQTSENGCCPLFTYYYFIIINGSYTHELTANCCKGFYFLACAKN